MMRATMLKKATMLLSGSALGSLLLLARNLIVARMVSPEDYGIATTLAAAMSVVEMLSYIGLNQLIVIDKDGDTPEMQRGLQGFQVLRGCLSALVLFLAARPYARFVGAAGFDDVTAQAGRHDDIDDKITPKVEALTGCALLFVLAIGGPSAAKVVKAGIHPVKRKDPGSIADIIEETQTMLKGSPPPFLRKILGRGAPKPSFMDDDTEEYAQ